MQFKQTMKRFFSVPTAKGLCGTKRSAMMLLAVMMFTMTAQTAWAAEWPSYITDVVLVGGTESEAQDAKSDYSGYTWCAQRMNEGSGADIIYIGYKTSTSANTNGGYITDFIIIDAGTGTEGHNPPSELEFQGHTYNLCPAAGGNYFVNSNHGNLTSQASKGWNMYLYYTKENFSDKRAVSSITINDTKSGALNLYYKNGNLHEENISLNRGVSGTPYVFMHISTATKVNRPNPEPTANSGLTYNGSPQKLISPNYSNNNSGTLYYRVGSTGSYTANVNNVTATNAGTYTVWYYSAESYYGNSSVAHAHSMTVTIAKAPNSSANVTCSNYIEGTAPDPVVSNNLSSGAITYKYSTSQNGTYTTTVPTSPGTYWVKATIAGNSNYNEYTTAATSFTIIKDWGLYNNGNTEDDAYIISSPEQLVLLSERVNAGFTGRGKFFKVTEDITFTYSTAWDNASSTENNFAAIGGGNDRRPFYGTFDGGGKTIKGIRIYQPDSHYEGLFGEISNEAVVKNVILSDARITANSRAGAIVGVNGGIVSNCAVSSNVAIVGMPSEDQYHGGIVGNNGGTGTVEGCRSMAKLTCNGESSSFWGGIAGTNSGTLKNNIVYNATVNSNQSGAIVGEQNDGTLLSNYYFNCTINGAANASDVGTVRSDIDGARKGVQISAATNISIAPTGDATTYDVSKITVYEGNNALKFLTFFFFSGATETVSLDLTHSSADGYAVKYYDSNDNELTNVGGNTYTYTMSNQALSIKAKLIPDWAQKNSGDTEGDAYVISTTEQLDLLSDRVNAGNSYANKFFKLGDNLTYTKATTNNFTPIGTQGHPFSGNFDGNKKTISGLNINLGETDFVGLFGYAKNGATIKNLKLDDSTIGGHQNVGAILGYGDKNTTTVENCLVTSGVTVNGLSQVSGIIGAFATICGCVSAASVSGLYSVGGIIGNGNQSTVTNCLYTGSTITGDSKGAIVGFKGNGSFYYNFYTGDLDCGGTNEGDDDGARKAVKIDSSSAGLAINPTGTQTTYSVCDIYAYSGSTAIFHSGDGVIAGAGESVNLNITYTSPYEGFSVTGYTYGEGETPTALTHVSGDTYKMTMPATTVYITPTGSDLWGVTTDGRDGSAEHPYLITTTEGLDLLAKKVNSGTNYAGKYFELGNDITYSYASLGEGESNYTAIGTKDHDFRGKFDGKGHTISGIRINANADNQGLFGYIHYAEVKNLTIDDTHITIGSGNKFAGAITGYSNVSNLIENCHITNSVIVSGGDDIGGIVGDMECIVRGCTSAATVSGNNRVGGLVGYLVDDDIENCLLLGATISGNDNVGIFAGETYYGVYKHSYYIGTSINGAAGSDAYEFTAASGAMGTKGTTYAAGTDYEGITVYENGLAYNGKFYCPSLWSGNGTEEDPYVIYNTQGLDKLASDVNGGNEYRNTYFVLGADIAYDKTVENNYSPIGKDNWFSGTFDGQGHTISGIRISDTDGATGVDKAIFGQVNGTVKNLVVSDCRIEAYNTIGGIVALLQGGTTENCHVGNDVTLSGNAYVGGILAHNEGGTVKGCTSAATIIGTEYYDNNAKWLGGIAGYAKKYGEDSPTLTDNLFTGTVSCELINYIGAIVGWNDSNAATLTNNYHTLSGMGGIGNEDNATGSDVAGATIAYELPAANGAMGAPVSTYAEGTDYEGITVFENGLAYNGKYYSPTPWSGSGTEEDPYVIYTTQGLDKLANDVNSGNLYSGEYFALGADIAYDKTALTLDLDDEEGLDSNFPGIGSFINADIQNPFVGSLDGRGHTISGIVINRPSNKSVGLFSLAVGKYIKNLTLANSNITGNNSVGAIVGEGSPSANIENCHVTNDVTVIGSWNVGGIVGKYAILQGCTSAATVNGTVYVGGILGDSNASTVRDCLYLGNSVTANSNRYVGAIVGSGDNTTLENNYHTCYGLRAVGSNDSDTGSDVDGARFAVSATNKPDAIMGDPTAVYGKDDYIGITAYSPNGLLYNNRYYWHEDLMEIPLIDDRIDNDYTIAENDGKIVNVLLVGRSFRKDGKWSTIVLPFDVDLTTHGCPLHGAIIRTVADQANAISGTTLNLTFGVKQNEEGEEDILMAGVPYLIRWERPDDYEGNESMYDIENPLFRGVKITRDINDFWGEKGLSFVGIYDFRDDIVHSWGENSDVLLLDDDNNLHYATPGESLGACRACFVINRDMMGNLGFRLTDYVFDLGNGEMLSGILSQHILPGDVNNDGKVTPADAIMILYDYFGVQQTEFNREAADLNGDNAITPADAIEALYRYFGAGSGNGNARSLRPTTNGDQEPE